MPPAPRGDDAMLRHRLLGQQRRHRLPRQHPRIVPQRHKGIQRILGEGSVQRGREEMHHRRHVEDVLANRNTNAARSLRTR